MIQVIFRTLAAVVLIAQAASAAPPEDRPATDKERARVTAALEKRGYKNIHDVEVVTDASRRTRPRQPDTAWNSSST